MLASLHLDEFKRLLEENKIPEDATVVLYTGGQELDGMKDLVDTLASKSISVAIVEDALNKRAEEHFDVPTLTEEMQKQMYETIKKSMETIGIETEYKSMVEARNRKNNKFNAQQLKNRSRYLNKHPRK